MVEIDKEKEQLRIERLTTGMFPKKADAPNEETYFKVRRNFPTQLEFIYGGSFS